MRCSMIFGFILFTVAYSFGQKASEPADVSVVTIEPPCAEWQMPTGPSQQMIAPHITIRYNPQAPGARLASAQSLTLVVASPSGMRYETSTFPMTRADGPVWQVDFVPKRNHIPGYAIFFFEDEKNRTDNHGGQYWDILNCSRAVPDPFAVGEQASTYDGRLLAPGIQRPPDLERAIAILKDDSKRYGRDNTLGICAYELKLGGQSPSAYEQLSREIDAFISAHGNEPRALRQLGYGIAPIQQKLSSALIQRFRQAVVALPQTAEPILYGPGGREVYHVARDQGFLGRMQREVSAVLAELDYWHVSQEGGDLQKQAADYLAFAAKYPETLRTQDAYQNAFSCEEELKDVAGAEAVFEKMAASDPASPFPLIFMARLYVDQKIKLDRAVDLLNGAERRFRESQAPSVTRRFRGRPGELESLRGQAYLLLNDLSHACTDFEAAAQATPDNPKALYALGEVREKMGESSQALEAYLAAASLPYQESSTPHDAYERLFVAQKLGTSQDAENKMLERAAQNSNRAAADYTPVAMNRPAPEFAFTDLAGKRFDNQAATGKLSVMTFWSLWCAPCVAEMPAMQEFQRQHPEVTLLAVEVGNKPEEVKAFLSTHKLEGLRVAVCQDFPKEFGGGVFPYTLVVDRFGQIQFVHAGQLTDVGAILGKDLAALPAAQ